MSIYSSSKSSRLSRNPYGENLSDRHSQSEEIEDYYAKRERQLREEKQNIGMIKTAMYKFDLIPYNRIDEGILDSIKLEFKGVCLKFSYVLLPRQDENSNKLRNWDLWGPFFMCIIYLFFVNNSTQFFLLFYGCFLGAIVVSFNVRLLGGQISYFQSVAILGYCMFPIFMGMFVLKVLLLLTINNTLIDILMNVGTIIWAIIAARAFVAVNVPSEKKFVALYPIILFYIFIGLLLIF